MSWQYWHSAVIYSGVGLLTLPLMIKYRLTPYHLIFSNAELPYGGMEIGSKSQVLEYLRGRPAFLEHLLLKKADGTARNTAKIDAFMAETGLEFPLIAKPDLGCVGFGVRKVHDTAEILAILDQSPSDYLIQEYCAYPMEYSIFFVHLPGSKEGFVPSLTEKVIPSVTGDGRSSLRELISRDARYRHNRKALLRRAKGLDRVPPPGETVDILVQASHTYGTFFFDRCAAIDRDLEEWMNRVCDGIPGFRFIRFDLKALSRASLKTGEGVKIMEVNGCMSEPIHMYDPRHSLQFGAREFFRFYDMAFRIARSNRKNGDRPPYGQMNRAFLRFFRNKKAIMKNIG